MSPGADDAAGHGKQARKRNVSVPICVRVDGGRRPGFGPGDQIAGPGDDFEPDLVGLVAVERQLTQAGVLDAADTVLASGTVDLTVFPA